MSSVRTDESSSDATAPDLLPELELQALKEELQRVQEELISSRTRYFELYELAPVGYVTLDAEGEIRRANRTVTNLLGLAPGALVGLPLASLVAPPDQEQLALLRKHLAETGDRQSCELRLMAIDGPIWAQLEAASGADESTMVTRVALSDITQRKSLELQSEHGRGVLEALTGGKSLAEVLTQVVLGFEALFLGMRGSVLLLDEDGRRLRHAAAPNVPQPFCLAIDGIEIGPSVGSCGTAAFTGNSVLVADIANDPLWKDFKDLALRHGLRACWSVPVVATSGRILGSFAFYFDQPRAALPSERTTLERGAQLASVAVERFHAEATLRESEQRREVALWGADLGLWDWNVVSGRAVFDARWCAILGYLVDELAPEVDTWRSLLHPDDLPSVQAVLTRHLEGVAADYDVEFRLRHKAGHWIWVLSRGKVVERDAGGAALRMAGTHLDITARKKTEEALHVGDKRNAKLERQLQQATKMQAVGRLAGGVAHDFNNMLAVIQAHVGLALEAVDPSLPLREDLLVIEEACGRAGDVTRQLLAFARQQTIAPRVLDLNETVARMLKLLLRILGEDIEVSWQPAPSLWPVEMDPTQIDQIVTNLCVNAKDAITNVGHIVLRTSNVTIDAEYCAERPEFTPGDYVRLSVTDDGAGIAAEVLPNIFEPFFTTKRVGEGTGLGLATVYGIVQQNRGHVAVSSERGQGTSFDVFLPRAAPANASPNVGTAVAPKLGRGERILLVEDEPLLLSALARQLVTMGYSVLRAESPADALRIADDRTLEIDLLVTDLVMPGMNGRELAFALQVKKPRLRCLFMSGYAADVIGARGVVDRGVHFIQKPFSIVEFARNVHTALSSPSSPDAPDA